MLHKINKDNMKLKDLFFFSAILLVTTTVSALAQKPTLADTIASRAKMVRILLGENPGPVQAEAPYKDGQYMPFSVEMPNVINGNKFTNYLMQMGQSPSMQEQETGVETFFTSYDYKYVASHGCTSPQSYGTMFYVGFTESKYIIVKCDTHDNNKQTRSGFYFYNSNQGCEVPDFREKSYLEPFREQTTKDMDMVNNWVSNDTRRNEIFQGFIDLNTMDYNGDGVDDLFLLLGNTLHIFDGVKLTQIFSKTITTDVDCSPSSVIYDFNGDGINDYLCMVAHTNNFSAETALNFDGAIVASKYDNDALTYNIVDKKMNAADVSSGENKTLRATLKMGLHYPDGRFKAPKVAMAVTEARFDHYIIRDSLRKDSVLSYTLPNDSVKKLINSMLNRNDSLTSKEDYHLTKNDSLLHDSILGSCDYIYTFDQYLTMVDVSSSTVDKSDDVWYRADARKNQSILCNRTTDAGYFFGHAADRRRPFLFGRPALCSAFTDGWDNPQQIFWGNNVYNFNATTKEFSCTYEIPNKHDYYSSDEGFDRVVGGQIEAIRTSNGFNEGKEAFAFILSTSYNRYDKGTIYDDYDWADGKYQLATLWRPTKDSNWTYDICYTLAQNGNEPMTLAMGKIAKDKGAKVKFISSEVTCSNPIISYVLAAPPYVKGLTKNTGSVMFSQTKSESASETQATTESSGGGAEVSMELLKWLKISTRLSFTKSWSNSTTQTISSSEERASGTSEGIDYVVFNYMPADLFTYEITECDADKELVGTKFNLTKVRDAGIMQKGMPVTEFNDMVAGTTCPQITSDVLPHTVGYVGSYRNGLYKDADIRKAFNVADSDYFRYSQVVSVPAESATEELTLSYGKGGSESYSESTNTDVTVSFSIGMSEWKFGGGGSYTHSWGDSWTQLKTWNNSYSISATLPNVYNPDANHYTYCLVWYQHRVKNSDDESDNQNYMVANWYVVDDQTTISKTLAEIMSEGNEKRGYTIKDDLTVPCTSINGNDVYAKDGNNYTPRQEKGAKTDPWNNADFDQSNWIRLVGDSVVASSSTGSVLIPGGTVSGTFSRDEHGNPTFNVISGKLKYDDCTNYSPNVNYMANFALVQPAETQNYFLVTPKPYEYLNVKGAALNADCDSLYMPAKDNYGTIGKAKIDWSLCDEEMRNKFTSAGEAHNFTFNALVYRNSLWPTTLPSEATADGGWVIAPVNNLTVEEATGIGHITTGDSNVESVKYVDMSGSEFREVSKGGIYIKVIRYTNGTTSTQKVVK